MKLLERINKAGLLLQNYQLTSDPHLKIMYRNEYEIEWRNIQFIKKMGKEFEEKLLG